MNKLALKGALEREALELQRAFKSEKAAALGDFMYPMKVIPTGIMALDYALGTGGWPVGFPVEIFGAPDVGKSSTLGLSAIRNAQEMGMLCGIIAIEPGFDPEWARDHGVDPELLIVARPKNGEEAFHMLHRWIAGDIIDLTIFDSVGALLSPTEAEVGGKARAGGQSGLITWGAKNAAPPMWRNNKSVIFLNQIRDKMDSRFKAVESPGGHALKHACPVRVHLRQKEEYTVDLTPDEKGVVHGRRLLANIVRNKLSKGSRRKAEFDYYIMETDDHGIGVDMVDDVVNTAVRAGVIQKSGGWYTHDTFPPNKKGVPQLQGIDPVGEHLLNNADAFQAIRNGVLEAMLTKFGTPKPIKWEEMQNGRAGE